MRTPEQLSAELYDVSVPNWDGEIDFYRELAREVKARGKSVLEVACGTGRVTLRLAQEGVDIVGTDLDEEMLKVARGKSEELPNVRWVRGDMRTLDLGQTFGLIISPGHSFQFMLTPEGQVQALETFKRHLEPGGTLVIHLDHQSLDWLGDLLRDLGGKFEAGRDSRDPQTNHLIRKANAWTFARSTQTATVVSRWEELDEDGSVLQMWQRKPMALHCVFRFEMEHLLARVGFEDRVVYGDFFKNPL
ncbi:MAG TPA: class I SAM-dependent methyltransferase, partial [Anaerolineales bacterium]|nr:class I SAM-dependent methyltransferase [Anaerolineales bacterium]